MDKFVSLKVVAISTFNIRPKVVAISVRNTIMRKFANFVRLYFPHITTFFNQILRFYFGNVVFLVGTCLEQKLVYKENCLLHEPVYAIMEIISVDFYKIYRVSLSGKTIVLLFCTRAHDEKK